MTSPAGPAKDADDRAEAASARLQAVRPVSPLLDRDRAVDAWIAELYQAALRPEGWQHFLVSLAGAVGVDPAAVVAIATQGRELRHFAVDDPAERGALARLCPNLRAAASLREQLRELRLERDACAQLLDRLPVGVLIVDARARVVTSNRVARDILARVDGLSLRDGLEAANATDTAELRRAVAAVVGHAAGTATRERLRLLRPSGARPWMVEVTRVERDGADGAARDAAAAVVISDGRQVVRPSPEALQAYFELTPAEAELATLLASGLPLTRAAGRRRVSRNTARGQLKRIFAKTETNRQAELVRLILSGPTGLASD
jgi:DNA-binding CsgD family transcriptional regulator/PAS domain-containing protein